MKLTPYPVYKPSGIEWLGEVPAHWDVMRLKASVANVIEQNHREDKHEIRLALEHVESWTGRYNDTGPNVHFDSQVKYFQANDVLFGKLRPYLAKVVRPDKAGMCAGEFLVLRPRGRGLSAPYLEQLIRSKPIIDAVNSSTFGAKMPRADWQFIGNMRQPLPPLPEQTAIVRYLNYTTERIQSYINAKERLINLLAEQRQAIIQRAVTRGLDPNVRLKPSGVEWLGEVPAHWEMWRLKHAATLNPSRAESRSSLMPATAVTFLPMERVRSDGRIDPQEIIPASKVWKGFTYFRKNDVLVAKITPCFENGKGAHLHSLPTEVGFGSTEFHVLRAKSFVLPQFLYLLTKTSEFRRLGADAMTGAAGQQRVPSSFVANYSMSLPPLSEQTAIVEYLEKATADIDSATHRARREIELLKEYHTRLSADVVTGKLDVREAAFKLPEAHDELSISDKPELQSD